MAKAILLTSVIGGATYAYGFSRCRNPSLLDFVWLLAELFLLQYLVYSVWRLVLRPHYFSSLRHLPTPGGHSLLMGQWKRIYNEPIGAPMADWVANMPNDGMIRFLDLFNSESIIPTSAQAFSEILSTKSDEFIKPAGIGKAIMDVIGKGVLFSEGDEHKILRKNLLPSFSYRRIKGLYPTFWSKSCELLEYLATQPKNPTRPEEIVVNISDLLSRATLDILGAAGFGHDFGTIKNADTELSKSYHRVFSPDRQTQIMITLNLYFPSWLVKIIPVRRNRNLYKAAKVIKGVCREVIQRKRALLAEEKGETNEDVLSLSIKSGVFSEDSLVDQVMAFIAAGHETTASACIWAVCFLCTHPEVQSRLRADIRATLSSPITSNQSPPSNPLLIDRIPYLNAVCNEVLRLQPPAPVLVREVATDNTTLLGQPLPKGIRILLVPLATNRDPKLWGPDSNLFNPERWMGPGRANSGGAPSNYAFMTFIHGPRSCLGESFSRAEFAHLLAALVGRYEMELVDPKMAVPRSGGMTSKPMGVLVRMRPIKGW